MPVPLPGAVSSSLARAGAPGSSGGCRRQDGRGEGNLHPQQHCTAYASPARRLRLKPAPATDPAPPRNPIPLRKQPHKPKRAAPVSTQRDHGRWRERAAMPSTSIVKLSDRGRAARRVPVRMTASTAVCCDMSVDDVGTYTWQGGLCLRLRDQANTLRHRLCTPDGVQKASPQVTGTRTEAAASASPSPSTSLRCFSAPYATT